MSFKRSKMIPLFICAILALGILGPVGLRTAHAATVFTARDNGEDTITQPGDYILQQSNTGTAVKYALAIQSNVGVVNLTLKSVNITTDWNTSPIQISGGNTLNLALDSHSTSTLVGSPRRPAICVSEGSTLTITSDDGTGTLNAIGGAGGGLGGGAGIGAVYDPYSSKTGTINIEGGIIHAVGGADINWGGGAGIGSSGGAGDPSAFTCGNINISGGIITAVGKDGAAGIGGGCGSAIEGMISISGGLITPETRNSDNTVGLYNIGIGPGSGARGGVIDITGGTISSAGYAIGGSNAIYIRGGSVEAASISGTPYISGADRRGVHKVVVRIPPPNNRSRQIDTVSLLLSLYPYDYGFKDMRTNPDGDLFLYLPSGFAEADITIIPNSYPDYHGEASSGALKRDQSPLTVTNMKPKYSTGATISPGTSGGSGSGTVSLTYTGRNGTSYGPDAAAPSGLGDYTVKAVRAGDNTYYDANKSYDFSIIPPLTVEDIPDQTYTGVAIEPDVTVKDGSTVLTEGMDYEIAYSDNTDAGTATVDVTGKNAYDGIDGSGTFTIDPKDITAAADITVDAITAQTYTGSDIEPEPNVHNGSTKLAIGTDYELGYLNNRNVGTATAAVTGKGNYTGSKSVTFTISPDNISTDTDFGIDPIEAQTYTGGDIKPAPDVYDGSTKLAIDTDYEVGYSNNRNVGTATAAVTGKGNYTGSKSVAFTINPDNISTDTDFSIDPIGARTYTGSGIEPEPNVYDGSTKLAKDTDYELSYRDNRNVGTATVTVTGKGNYTGSKSVLFTISPKDISTDTDFSIDPIAAQTYTGSDIRPTPNVYGGSTKLAKDTDYELGYSNNRNVGTAAAVTVTGKGNYSGGRNVAFTINPDDISTDTDFSIASIGVQAYTGRDIQPEPDVYDGSTKLTKGTDYTLEYSSNRNAGTATVIVTGKGNYTGSKSVHFTIQSNGSISMDEIPSQAYSGGAITPDAVVKDALGRVLIRGTEYTLAFANNTNAGLATATATGTGNYAGTCSRQFTIAQRQISVELSATGASIQDNAILTAKIIGAAGLPQGTVTFKADDMVIASGVAITQSSGNYLAQAVWTGVPAGSHTLTATYVPATGDNHTCIQNGTLSGYSASKRDQSGFSGGLIIKTYGDADFALSPGGGQGMGGIYFTIASGTDVVSLSGSQVHILGAGAATVLAHKSGDIVYNETAAQFTIQVNKAQSVIQQLPAAPQINIGDPLSSGVLTGGKANVPGAFAWQSPGTTVLKSGEYQIVFLPADSRNYLPATGRIAVQANTQVDGGSDVTVDLGDTDIPEDVTDVNIITIEVPPSDAGYDQIRDILNNTGGGGSDFVVYRIELTDQDQNAITGLGGEYQVKMPVPQGLTGKLAVYSYDAAAGRLIRLEYELQDGYIVFKTGQTSGIVIESIPDQAVPAAANTAEIPQGSPSGTPSNLSPAGPDLLLILLVVLGCCAAVAIVLYLLHRRRRKG